MGVGVGLGVAVGLGDGLRVCESAGFWAWAAIEAIASAHVSARSRIKPKVGQALSFIAEGPFKLELYNGLNVKTHGRTANETFSR